MNDLIRSIPTIRTLAETVIYPDWPAPLNVKALVTTRHSGFSSGGYGALNLGARVGDDPVNVAKNRAALRELLPAEPSWLAQVHGTDVVDLDQLAAGKNQYPVSYIVMGEKPVPGVASAVAQADASVTRSPHLICAIQSADCMPVLFASSDGNVVAAAHAGWRGLANGVLESTFKSMNVAADKVLVYLGPAISQTAFEVGAEVREIFLNADTNAEFALREVKDETKSGKWTCDLYVMARLRLASVGITRVFGGNFCTYKDSDRFFSYRRDRSCGRFASLIWLDS